MGLAARLAGSQQKDQSRYSDLRHFDVSKRRVPVVQDLFRRLCFAVSMGARLLCYTVHLSYARFVPFPFSKGIFSQYVNEKLKVVQLCPTLLPNGL